MNEADEARANFGKGGKFISDRRKGENERKESFMRYKRPLTGNSCRRVDGRMRERRRI